MRRRAPRHSHKKHKVRVGLKVKPGAAEVGALVTLKGAVKGARGKSKVKVYADGAMLGKVKTKKSGKFTLAATVPANRTFKACVRKRCDTEVVKVPPDVISYAWTWEGYTFSTRAPAWPCATSPTTRSTRSRARPRSPSGCPGTRSYEHDAGPQRLAGLDQPPAGLPLDRDVVPADPDRHAPIYVDHGDRGRLVLGRKPVPVDRALAVLLLRALLSGARGKGVGTLGPGESRYNSFEYEDSLGADYETSFIVPESSLSTVLAQLKTPAFWILSRGLGGPDNEHAKAVCRADVPVVATSKAGLTVCAQGVQ